MELLFTILNLLTFVAIGYILRKINLFSHASAGELNSYVFKVAFPINIIMSFYGRDLSDVLKADLFLYIGLMFIISFAFAYFVACLLHPDRLTRAVSTVAIYRGNFIIMGFPILTALFGEIALVYAGIVIALSQFFYNLTTAWLYERAIGGKSDFKNLLLKIIKNPMLIGVLIGIIINALKINIYFLEEPFRALAATATPFGLMILGHGLDFTFNREYLKDTLIISLSKLICLPLIGYFVAGFFPITEIEKTISVILFGCPTAIISFTFAKNYRANTDLAQNYVLYTTLLFSFTIYLVLNLIS